MRFAYESTCRTQKYTTHISVYRSLDLYDCVYLRLEPQHEYIQLADYSHLILEQNNHQETSEANLTHETCCEFLHTHTMDVFYYFTFYHDVTITSQGTYDRHLIGWFRKCTGAKKITSYHYRTHRRGFGRMIS